MLRAALKAEQERRRVLEGLIKAKREVVQRYRKQYESWETDVLHAKTAMRQEKDLERDIAARQEQAEKQISRLNAQVNDMKRQAEETASGYKQEMAEITEELEERVSEQDPRDTTSLSRAPKSHPSSHSPSNTRCAARRRVRQRRNYSERLPCLPRPPK